MEWIGSLVGIALLAWIIRYFAAPEVKAESPSAEAEPPPDEEPEPVELPIEDYIDLHPFAPQEIPQVVDSYLEAAQQRGFREVRLVHGRGKGVQRARVRSLVSDHPLVVSFQDAPPSRGGWGATLVILKGFAPRRPEG